MIQKGDEHRYTALLQAMSYVYQDFMGFIREACRMFIADDGKSKGFQNHTARPNAHTSQFILQPAFTFAVFGSPWMSILMRSSSVTRNTASFYSMG